MYQVSGTVVYFVNGGALNTPLNKDISSQDFDRMSFIEEMLKNVLQKISS
jgi:hypothetical protein